ncbi:transposase, partial [Gluconobacter cerinus]|uniref:transposase n=1 Tax=Gluconobacter cerinus TaxID=38307 RepID=UPI001B8D1540
SQQNSLNVLVGFTLSVRKVHFRVVTPNRSIINGILWRLRCGTPCRDIPPKYGKWNTIYRGFRRWSEAGVWEAVAVTQAKIMADSGHYSIDSTTVRAHVSAAGGKGELIDELLAARGAGAPVSFIT